MNDDTPLPDTHETRLLAERYEKERLLRQAAMRKMAETFNIPAFDINKSEQHDHFFEDGQGNHYEANDIADAVLRHFMARS